MPEESGAYDNEHTVQAEQQQGVEQYVLSRVSPERLARHFLRLRERIADKENIAPEKHGGGSNSRRRRIRRRMPVRQRGIGHRSPLPPDYPRAPFQDITYYISTLERSRSRIRGRRPGLLSPRHPPSRGGIRTRILRPEELESSVITTNITPSFQAENPEQTLTNARDPLTETQNILPNLTMNVEVLQQQQQPASDTVPRADISRSGIQTTGIASVSQPSRTQQQPPKKSTRSSTLMKMR